MPMHADDLTISHLSELIILQNMIVERDLKSSEPLMRFGNHHYVPYRLYVASVIKVQVNIPSAVSDNIVIYS